MPSSSSTFPLYCDMFQARPGVFPLKDAQDLMAYPFFSLAKAPRLKPIEYDMYGVFIRVESAFDLGIATIWDADILIWAASQIVSARQAGLRPAPRIGARPFSILTFLKRGTSAHNYGRLRAALNRLQATRITTSLRCPAGERFARFKWLDWRETADAAGQPNGIELTLNIWLYRLLANDTLVLTLDQAYFQLTGGLERWLYRIVRKHAGHQRSGWRFDLHHLYRKSAIRSPFRNFAGSLRDIVRRQPLPGYELFVEVEITGRVLLAFEPKPPPGGQAVNQIVRSHAVRPVGSNAPLSCERMRKTRLTLGPQTRNSAPNTISNNESNNSSVQAGVENTPQTCGEPAGDAP